MPVDKRWSARLQVLFGLVILGFVIYGAAQQWPQVQPVLAGLRWGWMAAAVLVQMLCFFVLPLPLWLWLHRYSKNFPFREALSVFFLSQPAKYLPGSIWAFPAKGLLLRQQGFSIKVVGGAVLYETLALCTGALALGWLGASQLPSFELSWLGAGQQPALNLSWVIAAGVVAGWVGLILLLRPPALLGRLLARWQFQNTEPLAFGAALRISILAILAATAAWVLAGLSFYLILLALGTAPGAGVALAAMAAFSISWLLGFVVFLSPGGIGVREASLIFLAGHALAAPVLYPAAILSRLVWSLGELMLYFLFSRPWQRPSHNV